MADFSALCEGTLISQLATGTTTGVTVQLKKVNELYSTVTWPTGAHEIMLVRQSEDGLLAERVVVASGTTQSNTTGVVTLGTLTRNCSLTDGTDTTGTSTTITWPPSTLVYVTWGIRDADQTLFKNEVNTLTGSGAIRSSSTTTPIIRLNNVTTAERDLMSASNGDKIYNTTTGTEQTYKGGAWTDVGDTGTADASTTVAGKVEIATAAQRAASTATGETGALLVPSNDALVKTSSGASDENKIPVLNASGQLATGFVDTSGVAAVPTGAMFQWLTDSAPTGYLLCYGQAVSRTTYSSLFAVISTTFGVGDNSTTFNIPDLRGRFPLGQDDMGGSSANRVTATEADTLGSTHGAETITLTDAEVPAQSVRINSDPGGSGSTTSKITDGTNSLTLTTANVGAGSSYTTEGGGGAHNNMPPNITVNYIIKT